jgi:hypothetical protein
MTCCPLLEDENLWKCFLRTASEDDIYHKIHDVGHIKRGFTVNSQDYKRLFMLEDIAMRFYKRRFNQRWMPF